MLLQQRSTYNEIDLLRQIAQGSEQAFRQLFNDYRKKLYTYIFRITESREAAEDTVQDIFLKLWSIRETLPAIENVSAYLHRMAHNYAYTGFRRLARESLVLAELKLEQPQVEEIHPGQELISKEVREHIKNLVDRLTPQQKKVFLLSREGGLKQEEIARKMNISIFAVKKHMVDALRFLREEIGQNYGSHAVAMYIIYQISVY